MDAITGSVSTVARHKCGMRPAGNLSCARPWTGLLQNPEAKVWRGSEVPVDRQGVKVLGAPIGHPVFVAVQLSAVAEHQETLLQRIPLMPDLQSAWLLLLHCAGARATYFLRVVNPEAALDYATLHDERMWSCLCRLLDMSPNLCDCVAKQCATLPLVLGGLILRSAVRTRLPAHWASWADCLPMIKERHPEVAASMVEGLQRVDTTECLRAVARAAEELSRLPGFVLPSWEALANGARPPVREPDQHEPGCQRAGRQHEGSARLEEAFRESLYNDRLRESFGAISGRTRSWSSVYRVPQVLHHTH